MQFVSLSSRLYMIDTPRSIIGRYYTSLYTHTCARSPGCYSTRFRLHHVFCIVIVVVRACWCTSSIRNPATTRLSYLPFPFGFIRRRSHLVQYYTIRAVVRTAHAICHLRTDVVRYIAVGIIVL